ncbi:MAG TPA: S8 family serine peptidase, partial [Thermoanaerobaculia bacterium]
LRAKNILPVYAVGNEGAGTSRYPGNYPEALSVGAVDENGQVADFSSSQRFARQSDPVVPDIVGPGVGVISAMPGGGYQQMDGSSMATPHIAGLAALLFQARPNATANDMETAIFQSCKLATGVSAERAGRGFPDASAALAALRP